MLVFFLFVLECVCIFFLCAVALSKAVSTLIDADCSGRKLRNVVRGKLFACVRTPKTSRNPKFMPNVQVLTECLVIVGLAGMLTRYGFPIVPNDVRDHWMSRRALPRPMNACFRQAVKDWVFAVTGCEQPPPRKAEPGTGTQRRRRTCLLKPLPESSLKMMLDFLNVLPPPVVVDDDDLLVDDVHVNCLHLYVPVQFPVDDY
jgi:hypothetical protein